MPVRVGEIDDSYIGTKLGSSDWFVVDQDRISRFGEITMDPDPMHIDPDWSARNSPFHSTVAFGFLTMSMLTYLNHQILEWDHASTAETGGYGLNYGFNRLRFVEPVPVLSRIRLHSSLKNTYLRRPGERILVCDISVEVEGFERPALVGEWLSMWVTAKGHARLAAKASGEVS